MNLFSFPLKKQRNQKYFLWDYETEGLNLALARPWQVGYGVWSINDGCHFVKERYIDVKDLKISDDAAKFTRFDRYDYDAKKEDSRMLLDEVESYLYNADYIIVGANIVGYDVMIHSNWRAENGLKPDYSCIDRMFDIVMVNRGIKINNKLTSQADMGTYMISMVSQRSRKIKASVEAACKEFGIEYDKSKAHGAGYDLGLTWEIFKVLNNKLDL